MVMEILRIIEFIDLVTYVNKLPYIDTNNLFFTLYIVVYLSFVYYTFIQIGNHEK